MNPLLLAPPLLSRIRRRLTCLLFGCHDWPTGRTSTAQLGLYETRCPVCGRRFVRDYRERFNRQRWTAEHDRQTWIEGVP